MNLIYDKIIELSEKFNIVAIAYDKYNAPQLVSRLQEAGFGCENFEQSAKRFNAPLKTLETFVYEDKIRFVENPCMLWNFANVVLYIDTNANIKITKNKQNDSVDGVVALGMSIGSYITSKYGEELIGLRTYLNSNK